MSVMGFTKLTLANVANIFTRLEKTRVFLGMNSCPKSDCIEKRAAL